MLQLEDILLLVVLQLQSALLSSYTRLRCLLFAHKSGTARRFRDPDTRQSGFLQHEEERNLRYCRVRFIDKSQAFIANRQNCLLNFDWCLRKPSL